MRTRWTISAMLGAWLLLIGGWWWCRPVRETVQVEAQTAAYQINVNAADAAELQLLPGVGAALAARIVAEREANGAFRDVDDLRRVRGIGPSVAGRAEGLVRFGK